MRKHHNEMIRFAHSEKGTSVWYRHKNETKWKLEDAPTWDEDYVYIVDDKYASLRKESIDTGIPIQVKYGVTDKWITPSHELNFRLPLEYYRLEPKKFNYPIYKKIKNGSSIVKFTDLSVGTIVWHTDITSVSYVGYKSDCWIEHTNTNFWEDVKEEVIHKLEKVRNSNYPIHKRSKSGGSIVKFTDLTVGIVVWDMDISRIGYESKEWIDHTDPDVWEDVKEEIIHKLEKVRKSNYPIYKKIRDDGSIVKFTDLSVGKVVKEGTSGNWYVGYKSKYWVDYTNTDVWDDVKEEEIENYRLESKKFNYPIYKRIKNGGSIVKFTDLSVGEVVKEGTSGNWYVGYTSEYWVDHTNTDVWEDVKEEIENYKLEFDYPIYKRSKSGNSIVKFTDLTVGTIIWDTDLSRIGHELKELIEHTDTDVWTDIKEEEINRLKKDSIVPYLKELGTTIVIL